VTHPNAAAPAAGCPVSGHAGHATNDRPTERRRRYRARRDHQMPLLAPEPAERGTQMSADALGR